MPEDVADDLQAQASRLGKRMAHGCLVLSAAAGLLGSPAPDPELASCDILTRVAKRS